MGPEDFAQRRALVSDLIKPQYGDEKPSDADEGLGGVSNPWLAGGGSSSWGPEGARGRQVPPMHQLAGFSSFAPLEHVGARTGTWTLQPINELPSSVGFASRSRVWDAGPHVRSGVFAAPATTAANLDNGSFAVGRSRIVLGGGARDAENPGVDPARLRTFATPLEELAAGVEG